MQIKYSTKPAMCLHLFLALLFVTDQKKNYFEANHSPSIVHVFHLPLLLSVLLSSLHVFKHMSGDNRMDKRKRGTIVTTAGNFFMSTEGQRG